MTEQAFNETPRSLWREQAKRWLNCPQVGAPKDSFGPSPDDPDPDPDPPPAAPAMRAWPRVFPPL
jgi:hypothetical protein